MHEHERRSGSGEAGLCHSLGTPASTRHHTVSRGAGSNAHGRIVRWVGKKECE